MPKQLGNETAYLDTPIEYHAFNSKRSVHQPKKPALRPLWRARHRVPLKKCSEMIEEIGCPSAEHSLDRIDVHGHYEPGNIKWSTKTEQARNRQNAVATIDGQTKPLKEWCEILGIKYHTVYMRMRRRKIQLTKFSSSFICGRSYLPYRPSSSCRASRSRSSMLFW